MQTFLWAKLCLVLAATLEGQLAAAASWFESATRKCDFESPVSRELPFPRKNSPAGGQYFSISKGALNQVLAAPNGAVEVSSGMSPVQLATLRTQLASLTGGPHASSVALATVGQISSFSGVYGLAAGALLSWLGSAVDAKVASLERLIDFVTVGGQTGHQIAFRSPPEGSKPLVLVMTYYQVQVGSEPRPRRWLVSACLLPIEVVLSEVTTTASHPNANNKRLSREADGTWRQWDIKDSKYDNTRYRYLEQDEAYAYFADVGDANSRMRIHIYSGPMQFNSGSGWKTVYPTTESK